MSAHPEAAIREAEEFASVVGCAPVFRGRRREHHATTLMPTEPRCVNLARIESPALGRSNFEMPPDMTISPGLSAWPRTARWLASHANAFRGFPITFAAV